MEHKGGLVPDYGFKEKIEYDDNTNLWNKISGYLSNNSTDMRVNNAIKERKGQEKLINIIMASPHKDILINNPNILKWFIAEKIVKPLMKRTEDKRKTKFFKRDTQEGMINTIFRKSGIQDLIQQINIKELK